VDLCQACHRKGISVKLATAKELAADFENLTKDERERLKASLDDLISNTPRTELASHRFKTLMKKAGGEATSVMRNIIVDILSEAAKKSIFGS
jgi:hypothetical protein